MEYRCKEFEEVGLRAGRKKLSNLKAMIETMSMTAQQAVDALRVPADEWANKLLYYSAPCSIIDRPE